MTESTSPVFELTVDTPGDWFVTTKSGSRYLVKIAHDGFTEMQRVPAPFTMDGDWSPSLYRDGEILMCKLVRMKVGQRGSFVYFKPERISDPFYVGSTRGTTIVESIRPIGR